MGLHTARTLAERGFDVVLACRDAAKGERAAAEVRRDTGGEATCVPLDLADLESVREFGAKMNAKVGSRPISRLVLNAGVMATPAWTTKQGVEFQVGTNHVGHHLLTNLLLPQLDDEARVVVVASAAHRAATALEPERYLRDGVPAEYVPWTAYGVSKTCNILFTRELARRLREAGSSVTANALCPGLVDTELGRYIVQGAPLWQKPLMALMVPLTKTRAKTVPDGCATALKLALSLEPEVASTTGAYWVDCELAESTELAADMQLARRLWDATEELIAERCPA